MVIDFTEKEFKCTKCGYESDDAIDFMKAVNTDDKLPILCNECCPEKEFNLKSKKKYDKDFSLHKKNLDLEEFNLSEKIINIKSLGFHNITSLMGFKNVFGDEKIKEFIKIILEDIKLHYRNGYADFDRFVFEIIKKRAGEKLI